MNFGKKKYSVEGNSKFALLILVFLSTLVGLALCELILYGYYQYVAPHSLSVWTHDYSEYSIVRYYNSPLIYTRKPNSVERIANKISHYNNVAFRRTEDTLETPANKTVRVLNYGDSIGMGWRVEDSEQYTNKLETMLNSVSSNSNWEVLSTARGSSPGIYTFHVRVEVPRFHPHWVMLEIELQNDLTDEALLELGPRDAMGMPRAVYGGRYLLSLEGVLIKNLSSTLPFISRTLVYSKVINLQGTLRSKIARNPLFLPESKPYYYNVGSDQYLLTRENIDHALDSMFESILAIKQFVEANNGQFLLVIIPGRDAFSKDKGAEEVNENIRKAISKSVELGITHVNTFPFLEKAGGEELFLDFCHPNPRGHEAIARALYDFFTRKEGVQA